MADPTTPCWASMCRAGRLARWRDAWGWGRNRRGQALLDWVVSLALVSSLAVFFATFWHTALGVTAAARTTLTAAGAVAQVQTALDQTVAQATTITIQNGQLVATWTTPAGAAVQVTDAQQGSQLIQTTTLTPPGGSATTTTQIIAWGLAPAGVTWQQPAAGGVTATLTFAQGGSTWSVSVAATTRVGTA